MATVTSGAGEGQADPNSGLGPRRRPWRTGKQLVAATACLSILAACGSQSATQRANSLIANGLKAQAAGNTAVATRDYNQVLAIDPRNKYALYDLGLIDQLAGNTASAESRYRAALAIDPNFARALFNLAILRTKVAPSEAVALYRQVIALDPNDAAAHFNLGLLLESMGQGQAGNAEVARAISLNPSLANQAGPPLSTTTVPAAKGQTSRP